MSGVYRIDSEKSAIEVRFPVQPSTVFRDILKEAKFRWNPKRQSWRAPYSRANLVAAQTVAVPERSVSKDDRPSDFEFGNALDVNQKQVVVNTEGPMLVVAGPGAGKTSALVKRISYLILEKSVPPESIMVATFSKKAAKELVTRLSNEFAGLPHPVNVSKMLVGTFHSICQQILSDYADVAGLKNYTVLDDFDQRFLVQNGSSLRGMREAELFHRANGGFLRPDQYTGRFVTCSNTLAEERVSLDDLAHSGAFRAAELAQYVGEYRQAMERHHRMDFADIQTRALDLLTQHPDVLESLRKRIRYIVVDEYQDTNFIQEQLVLLLAGDKGNVCVVGDDDQSLYRFRGATVQNILQFELNYPGECQRRNLVTNYRSQPGIVDFCRRWMGALPGYLGDYSWNGCRYDKDLRANPHFDSARINPVSVARCAADNEDDWHTRMLWLVRQIQQSPDFGDRNQIAFLCSSVRSAKVRRLITFFEENGVRVSAPRANLFFERREVRASVGCLIACFPSCDALAGFDECRWEAEDVMSRNGDVAAWVADMRQRHTKANAPDQGFDYGFSGLFFELMQFEPFSAWLDESDAMDVASASAARNMSLVAGICSRFEAAENYPVLTARGIESMPLRFFKKYLLGIIESGGIEEYEDEREYAPAGCVSFMTVHQAKGMEFPVVVVCSLEDEPWGNDEPLVDVIRSLNSKRKELEPPERRSDFDFWRKYYTAFSRAQDLLVLTSAGRASITETFQKPDPSRCFAAMYAALPDIGQVDFATLHLHKVKPANIMRTYSFTSDVAAYQTCPRRYKLYHELGYPQVASQGMLFGTLVHQCVEDIHRMVKRKRDAGEDVRNLYIPPEEVQAIVSANRASLEQAEGVRLLSKEREVFRQVMKYLKHSKGIWRDVVEPEAEVSEVRNGFVLKGVIDLIHGDDNCVEIVDFKTGKMPPAGSPLLEKYRRQMLVYVHLVRTQLGFEVSGAKLYFTSDTADKPVIDIPVTDEAVEEILQEFDGTVGRIESCEFSELASNLDECRECPFAAYCGRKG